ncbi:hypothetical protein HAZT_HAZT004591 [Hyalella azteca]|uniref:Uncharacterized protein n=1 Tax=Hyalella azteca TaxID=294128 RepID=A0A6A0H496_HYAAZ|nr:hypothetical protein HAZT_HAZT004591 [Hyalella azteca]
MAILNRVDLATLASEFLMLMLHQNALNHSM